MDGDDFMPAQGTFGASTAFHTRDPDKVRFMLPVR